MKIHVDLKENSYDIILQRGCINTADKYLDLNRNVLVISDEAVPGSYVDAIAGKCRRPVVCRVKPGEGSKSIAVFEELLVKMLRADFSRKDCVAAVGGGVVGDLAGFAAASYMRGVDFYNVPTTVLSQVDSSIGGKTAVNLDGVKNIVGAFYQPKRVLIDPECLKTLPQRQISNGLAEAVKMSLTSDAELFEIIETQDIGENIDTIIERSIKIKRDVVEKDEKEAGLRRVLNFGHTLGHGYEMAADGLYHGEAVALGMLPMCSDKVRNRLIPVLKKLSLPAHCDADPEKVYEAAAHDKKSAGGKVAVVKVNEIGSFVIEEHEISGLRQLIGQA